MASVTFVPSRISGGDFVDVPVPGSGDNGKAVTYNHGSGAFVYTGFEASGAVAAHVALANPHTQYLLSSGYTAADVLAKLVTVDGSGSGLDADLLRGVTPSAYILTLVDDADAATARTTLGLGALATAGVPGGTTQVIYNSAGALAGDAGMTYDAANDALTVSGRVVTGVIRPPSNSTTAGQWQNASGTLIFNVDSINLRFGNTATPLGNLDIRQTDGGVGIYMERGSNIGGGTGYLIRAKDFGATTDLWALDTKGNVASIGTYSVSPVSNNQGTLFSVGNITTLNNTYPAFKFANYYTTGTAGSMLLIGGKTDASGARFTALDIAPHINQSSTNGFMILRVSPYLAATGSGTKNLLDLGTNTAADGSGTHTTAFAVGSDGKLKTNQAATNTNTPSGATAKALPIYDNAGSLLGYIPVYGSAW